MHRQVICFDKLKFPLSKQLNITKTKIKLTPLEGERRPMMGNYDKHKVCGKWTQTINKIDKQSKPIKITFTVENKRQR